MAEAEKPDFNVLTVTLLSAYLANNNVTVASNELPELIRSTRAALENDAAQEATAETEYVPAVSMRKSRASRDHLISLIDGKPYKSLKRHLKSHGLTPAQYRERYKLPDDYPMVAPAYSEHRREVAQRLGLGRKKQVVAEPVAETVAATSVPPAAEPLSKAKRERKARPAAEKGITAPATSTTPAENIAAAPAKTRKPQTGKLSLFKTKSGDSDDQATKKEPSVRQRRKATPTPVAATQEPAAPKSKTGATSVAE